MLTCTTRDVQTLITICCITYNSHFTTQDAEFTEAVSAELAELSVCTVSRIDWERPSVVFHSNQ